MQNWTLKRLTIVQTLLLFLPSTLLNPRVGVINNSRKMATSIKLCPLANTQVIPVLHKNFQKWTANPTKCQNCKIEGGEAFVQGWVLAPGHTVIDHLVPCACTGDAERHGCSTPDVRVEALREKRHDMGTLLRCPARGKRKNSRKMRVGTSVMK